MTGTSGRYSRSRAPTRSSWTGFEIDHYQPILYVLESFEQLRDAMQSYAERILNEPAGAPAEA